MASVLCRGGCTRNAFTNIHVLCLRMRDPYIFEEEHNSIGFNPHLRVLVYTIAGSTCLVYWIHPDDLYGTELFKKLFTVIGPQYSSPFTQKPLDCNRRCFQPCHVFTCIFVSTKDTLHGYQVFMRRSSTIFSSTEDTLRLPWERSHGHPIH
jgi:hypothetical protein